MSGNPPVDIQTQTSIPAKPAKAKTSTKMAGRMFGHLKLIMRVRGSSNKAWRKEMWRMECTCGKRLTVPRHYIFRPKNPKRHCGCQFKSDKTHNNREYRIWLMMHERCLNPKHVSYQNYGGRGIQIHPSFLSTRYGGDPNDEGFKRWFDEVGSSKTRQYTLDRIDSDKNYEPGNLRWATYKEQAANKRKPQQ